MTSHVIQLSDTHFLGADDEPEGGFAYDTAEAFEAVATDITASGHPVDLVAVTGDVTDHGRPDQYRQAAEALTRLDLPVVVTPGNHDQHVAFGNGMARPQVATSRVVHIDNWCHLFVDSNAGVLSVADDGSLADADYHDRLHANGSLGSREAAWVLEQAAATDADHLFIWLHHPPDPPHPLSADPSYGAEWAALMPNLPALRGFGGGHTHVPDQYRFVDVPVFVAPSLKTNFDLQARTLLPPGYRTFSFGDDGTVASEVRLVDDPRWPSVPYGRAVHSLMMGELSWGDFEAIVARKQAATEQ